MAPDTKEYTDAVDRRRFLELAGLSGAAALAGCTDGGNGGNGGGGSNGGKQVYDVGFKNSGQDNPADTHFNSANSQTYSWNAGRMIHERYAAWNFKTSEFELAALKSWNIDGKKVTLTLRDDLTWDDGTDVTTEDMKVQWQILKKIGSTVWDFAESISVVDDKTMEVTLNKESNPNIIKFAIASLWMRYPASEFQRFVDKPASEVQSFKWNEPIGNGPWKFEEKNSQEFRFSRSESYYNAQNVNFQTMRILYRTSNTAIQQGLASGELHGSTSLFVPQGTVKTFPDEIVEVNIPAKWGYGMVFNHDDPIFGKRKVRQAIAHVINREQVVANGGPRTKFPAKKVCGIAPKDQKAWLGDRYSDFKGYGVGSSQTEKAASLMRDAGFSKSGGTWEDGDGNAVTADYLSPAGWTDFTTMTNTIVDQLNSFGFDLSVSTIPPNNWTTRFTNSNFQVGALNWLPGGARSSFPYFPLRHQLLATSINGGHNWPEGERTIPAYEGSGTMTINPIEVVKSIATTPGESETTDLVRRAAWHNNHDLPMLSLVSKFEQSWLTDNDTWDVVPKDHKDRKVKWPQHWLPRKGSLTATGN